MRHGVCVSASLSVLLLGSLAFAQLSPEEVTRRDLISQAEAARDAGDHPRAIELAARAAALRLSPSLALLLAQEHNTNAHPLEALVFAAQCVRDAEADPELRHRRRILSACGVITDTLSPRFARVTVQVPNPNPAGLRVWVQRVDLDRSLWGLGYPVNPGSITVEATSADGATFTQELSLRAGEIREVFVQPVRPAASSRHTPASGASLTTPDAARFSSDLHVRPAARSPLGPYAVMGAGVLTLGIAGVLYGLRQLAVSDRDSATQSVSARCNLDALQCNYAEAATADSSARSLNLFSNAALGVGVLTVTTGIVWWVVSQIRGVMSAAQDSTPRPRASLVFGPLGTILTLEGSL